MNCIGNIDESKTMMEQIDEYSVPGQTGGSYDVKDLKPNDKEFIRGMACMIDCVDNYEPFVDEDKNSTIGKIKQEIAKEVLSDLIFDMLGELGMNLYSIMDNDEDYWENDDEEMKEAGQDAAQDAAQPVLQPAT